MASALPPDDREMSLSEHLRELRDRLLVVICVTLVLMVAIFLFSGDLYITMLMHVLPSYASSEMGPKLAAYSPMELLKTKIMFCFIGALCIGFPLLVYEAFRFAAPGLYPHEKHFLKIVFPLSLALFIAGASIAYFFTLPLFFGLTIGNSSGIAASNLSVGETFGIVTNLMLGFGIVFQVPLVIVLAIRMGIVRRETLARGRIGVYGLLFAFTMFLSPDPTFFSQFIVLAILAVLFEVGLLISRYI